MLPLHLVTCAKGVDESGEILCVYVSDLRFARVLTCRDVGAKSAQGSHSFLDNLRLQLPSPRRTSIKVGPAHGHKKLFSIGADGIAHTQTTARFCHLGTTLARLELQIALSEVLRRIADFRTDLERVMQPNFVTITRGLTSLPATYAPVQTD